MAARTLADIELAFRASWSVETCDPVDVADWTADNPSRGQCGATALTLRELVGGDVLEAEVTYPDGSHQGFHYWNLLPGGLEVDLTAEQFSPDEQIQTPVMIEAVRTPPPRAAAQYLLLRSRVRERLGLPG